MPNSKWDDDHIESLLRDFPAIRDDRPKEEVYQRLDRQQPAKKKPKSWLPLLVAALAFITVGVLVASIISQNGMDNAQYSESSEGGNEDAATSTTSEMEQQNSLDKAGSEESGTSESFSIEESEVSLSPQAIYEEDLEGHTLFTIGMTENAFVIPVSFLIPDEQITRDFPNGNPSSVELYNLYANQLDEQALGFEEYHPYIGDLSMNGQAAEHQLPADHQYDMASASIQVYIKTLQETFKDIEEIRVLNEQGEAADFSQVGPMPPIETSAEKVAYYSYTTASGRTFAVPDYGVAFESAAEAIESLSVSPNDFLQSPIPEGVDYTISETDDALQIEFTEPVDLASLDEQTARRMIESFSLTAKPFGKQIQLVNTQQQQWQEFNLQEALPVPVAPNKLDWPLQ